MNITELRQQLKIKDTALHLEADGLGDAGLRSLLLNSEIYPQNQVDISDATPVDPGADEKVAIRGKAWCPIAKLSTDVLAVFVLQANELTVTLRYELPSNWVLSQTFSYLPFNTASACLYVTTRPHLHQDDRINLPLRAGINFVAAWKPDSVLELLKDLGILGSGQGMDKQELTGYVVLKGNTSIPTLPFDKFPWDVSPQPPGSYLQASLGREVSLPPTNPKVKFSNLRMQAYSPLIRSLWDVDLPCGPTIVYLADLIVPTFRSAPVATLACKVPSDSRSQLVLSLIFNDLGLKDFEEALEKVADIKGLTSVLPSEVASAIGELGPKSASIQLASADGKYGVAALQFTVGMKKGSSWNVAPDVDISFESLGIAVANPFDAQLRFVTATITGSTSLKRFGVELSVTASFPDIFISAEQIGETKVEPGSYFREKGLPAPPNFAFRGLSLVVQPPDFYFSIEVDSWPIEGLYENEKYVLPRVRLRFSNRDWQIEASTDEEHGGVPIVAVLYQLGKEAGDLRNSFAKVKPPAALKGFTVDYLSLSYSGNQFALVCDGSFRTGTASDGQITVRARVSVSKRDSTAFLAALDAQGLSLGNLVGAISPPPQPGVGVGGGAGAAVAPTALAEYVPQDFNLEFRNVLVAFVGGEQSKCLFAVDFGVDIDLANTISSLEFLKSAGLTLGRIGFEDLQILIANDSFKSNEVSELNQLLPRNFRPIPLPAAQPGDDEALHQGVNLSGKLLLPGGAMPLKMPAELTQKLAVAGTPKALAQKSDAPATKWFDIQKSLGPLYLGRVGFQYRTQKKTVNFLVDSSIELLGLRLALMGLRVGLNIANLAGGPKFELDGLELSVQRGPITISGGLLLLDDGFVGSVLIKSELFSIFGLGAYEDIEGQPSLFIFAVLDKDLGGPPCFHVTGLAFGFGYNRKLTLPAIEGVSECGLVKAATQPDPTNLLTQALQINEQVSTPAVGEYWLAAGVKFTSFEMIQSFALLSVSFGTETVVTILGLSKITVPAKLQQASKDVPIIACAELAFKVSFRPDSGVLAAEAQLTANSYVFSTDCKISGGFAFYAWFKDIPDPKVANKKISAGDFVVSLGGYHPKFDLPAHYPKVPRLQLDWKLDKLQITGEVYFALTPSCLMLGGRLSAMFQDQGFRAWFVAYVDFMIAWQPLAYQAEVGLRIGVAYLGTIAGIAINFGIELSAQLELCGPPLWGRAEIQCTFISFTIEFGTKPEPKPLNWEQFKRALLPEDNQSLTIAVVGGLIKELKCEEPGTSYVVVNPYQLQLLVKSAVPVQKAFKDAKDKKQAPILQDMNLQAPTLGIKPMGLEKLDVSSLTIKVSRNAGAFDEMKTVPVLQNVPKAMWEGKKASDAQSQKEQLIADALCGMQLVPPDQPKAADSFEISKFDSFLKTCGKDKPDEAWHYDLAMKGGTYDPEKIVARIKDEKQQPDRYSFVQQLTRQGWLPQDQVTKDVLTWAYTKMQFRDPPVECLVGRNPQVNN